MIALGKYNELEILRETLVGLFLGFEEGEDVLLPNKYCPETYEIGDIIKVFVYLDHEERIIATNLTPHALVNEFALMRVVDLTEIGAFMDWGLEKHLLVPFSEQRQKMQLGRSYIIYVGYDDKTDRLFGSNKINRYINNDSLSVKEGEKVNILVYQRTDLGYAVIINNIHRGLIYENEAFEDLNIGDQLPAFIKKIRPENKIDISLKPIGFENYNDGNCTLIMEYLHSNNGFLPLHDKSSPEDIYNLLSISKKSFKKAVGVLYKKRQIELLKDGVRLV